MAAAARTGCGWHWRFSICAAPHFRRTGDRGSHFRHRLGGGRLGHRRFCRAVEGIRARGCDYICTTSGGVSLKQKIPAGPLYQMPLAEAVRRGSASPPWRSARSPSRNRRKPFLAEGQADMIATVAGSVRPALGRGRPRPNLGCFSNIRHAIGTPTRALATQWTFPESAEKRKRKLDVMREEERASQA